MCYHDRTMFHQRENRKRTEYVGVSLFSQFSTYNYWFWDLLCNYHEGFLALKMFIWSWLWPWITAQFSLNILLFSLSQQIKSRDPVYSVAFSPNGEYLASGSLDKCMHVWSVKEAKIVKTFTGNGGIFEVCWNKEGDKIAACFANNVVCVLDFRM